MLNRALYEDMVVAHRIKLNPVDAPEKYERNPPHLIEQMRGALAKHGAGVEMEDLPELTTVTARPTRRNSATAAGPGSR